MYHLSLSQRPVSVAIALAVAVVFSSFTLWLGDTWTKYPFFFLEVFVILMIYVILNNYEVPFRIKNYNSIARIFGYPFFDSLLVGLSALLFCFNILYILKGVEGGVIQLFVAFICTSFLPGYAFLNILRITKYLFKLETLILSSVLSFTISGFSTLVLLPVDESMRGIIIPLVFISIGLASILTHKKKDVSTLSSDHKKAVISRNIDIFAIALSVIFYIIFFIMLYPNGALVADTDATRHYNYAMVLSRSPDLYNTFGYLLFHAFSATLHVLSGAYQPIASFQTIQITLNVLMPLSVYALTRRFVGSLDRRIPAITTIFYTFLTNFSFISFTLLKLSNHGLTQLQLLQTIDKTSFAGIKEIAQPFSFFRPQAESFIMFIIAFLLMKDSNIPKSKFVSVFAILILAMYLTHAAEAVLFVFMISLYSIIAKNDALRLDHSLLASLIAFVSAGIIVSLEFLVWPAQLRIMDFSVIIQVVIQIILPILLISISILWRKKVSSRGTLKRLKILFKINFEQIVHRNGMFKFISRNYYLILSIFLVIVYLLGLLKWFNEDFDDYLVYFTGYLPWFAYPMLLGIVGLLTVLSIRYVDYTLDPSLRNIQIAILVFILILILVGRMVSYVNLNFEFIGYYENRFIIYIFLFASLLAPIPLIKLVDQVRSDRRKLLRTTYVFAIISVIVTSGFSSMILYSDFWKMIANESNNDNIPTENEWRAINYMKDVMQHDIHSFTIAISKRTTDDLAFATPSYQFFWTPILLSSKYPEIPLFSLAAYGLDHAYLFLDSRDFKILHNYPDSWFVRHLLPMLPVIFSNREVTIYNITHLSYPQPHSDTTMVIPAYTTDDSWLYSYDVISQSPRGNYTVALDADHSAFDSRTVILSTDPKYADQNSIYKFISYVKSGGHLIVLDPSGHGSISKYLLSIQHQVTKEREFMQVSDYKNNNSSFLIPIIDATLGFGKITYIDIHPMLSQFYNNKMSGSSVYRALGKISSLLNLTKTVQNPTSFQNIPSFPVFGEIRGTGNTQVVTESVIFPRSEALSHLRIWHDNAYNPISVSNVTSLNISSYKLAVITENHNNISLTDGKGLYAKFTFNNNHNSSLLNIHFDDKATITGLSNGNKPFSIRGLSAIGITDKQPVIVYVRQPKINFVGELIRNTEIPKWMLDFEDYKYSGKVSLSILMSDSHTLFDHISVDGKSQRVPPYYKYDEVASLSKIFAVSKLYSSPTLIRLLFLFPFLIAFIFIIFIPGRREITELRKQ